MKRMQNKRETAISLVALVVTIIVLLILAGITISSITGDQGILGKAKNVAEIYKKAQEEENTSLRTIGNEIGKYIKKEITYQDADGNTQTLTKDTSVGTKIGTTVVDGQTLDWYLFDVSDDGTTAYLVSTPTYWVPDTTKEVNGAWVPKLVAKSDSTTGAMNQAIQKKASETSGSNYSYSYSSSAVTYTPSASTLEYFKNVNSQWSAQRGSVAFSSLNENEQCACYLADEEIFAGIKDQVNNSEGNLNGKIKMLIGGASVEKWCNAYNKQTAANSSKITCEYQAATNRQGYIYKVNGTEQNSGWYTNFKTIVGNDIYGAAYTNNNTSSPFYSYWGLASPSSYFSNRVCCVNGGVSNVHHNLSYAYSDRFSLFASVEL